MQFDGIVEGIKGYLAQMDHHDAKSECSATQTATSTGEDKRIPSESEPQHGIPKAGPTQKAVTNKLEFKSTLKILKQLQDDCTIGAETTLSEILKLVETMTTHQAHDPLPQVFSKSEARRCYICRYFIREAHELYPSLCKPCGAFNLAECDVSSPAKLDLRGKTAFVSGGRVNLGFHTGLRLLRCGANVIVSSRYPRDAETKYFAEQDSKSWIDRLRIIGADFRTAKDVFRLVASIKAILGEWQVEAKSTGQLFLLVNNAAQTLTDPVAAERKAISHETHLRQLRLHGTSLVEDNGYNPSIRGGSLMPGGLLEACDDGSEDANAPSESYSSQKTVKPDKILEAQLTNGPGSDMEQTAVSFVQPKSSWVQSLDEIPYEDIITAHSVNTFVPLMLVRELLSVMPYSNADTQDNPLHARPRAHILNISSREGIFETRPTSSDKNGRHVHTNMSKAGLNMITETEAANLWRSRKIAMNTIDPGYMSAAPEMRGTACPIGFEDGVGRVLWSVANAVRGNSDMNPVWGRFLKHFGEIRVDVGLGR